MPAIPSSSYVKEHRYGKPMRNGWNTVKATGVKVNRKKDEPDSAPRFIVEYENEEGEKVSLWLTTDDSSNFKWAMVAEAYSLSWNDSENPDEFAKWLEDKIGGIPIDIEIEMNGNFANFKRMVAVGSGGEPAPAAAPVKTEEPKPRTGKGRW